MELNLSPYRINHFSQNGEDGVIEKLLSLLNITEGWIVEFGCWEGKHLSNTYYHFINSPFQRLLIEGEKDRFNELIEQQGYNRSILLNLFVSTTGNNSLNYIFNQYNITDIPLLSIDIDGEDLNVWNSLNKSIYKPKIVIIEFGKWTNVANLDHLVSCFKGYNLICVTSNFIFIRNDLGITSPHNVHELMRTSGSPEYDLFYGLITQEEAEKRIKIMQSEEDSHLFSKLAKPQYIYYV